MFILFIWIDELGAGRKTKKGSVQRPLRDLFPITSLFMLHGAYEVVRRWINKENREKPARIASLIIKLIAP